MSENNSQFIIYQTEEGETKLDVRFENETVWLTQKLIAELFSTTPENILMHLKNIYQEDELNEKATTKDFLVVRQEGTRQVKCNHSRSHAPAWECIPTRYIGLYAFPPRTAGTRNAWHTILTNSIWIPREDFGSQSIAVKMS